MTKWCTHKSAAASKRQAVYLFRSKTSRDCMFFSIVLINDPRKGQVATNLQLVFCFFGYVFLPVVCKHKYSCLLIHRNAFVQVLKSTIIRILELKEQVLAVHDTRGNIFRSLLCCSDVGTGQRIGHFSPITTDAPQLITFNLRPLNRFVALDEAPEQLMIR